MGSASESDSHLQSIKYSRGSFRVLDQLKVPAELSYRQILSVADGVDAIKTMQVRGAPLIAVVGCLSIAVELEADLKRSPCTLITSEQIEAYVKERVDRLVAARPTAVNMRKEGQELIKVVSKISQSEKDVATIKQKTIEYIEGLLKLDIDTNKAIGKYGADAIRRHASRVNVLTHCNTGSLATAGYGTALGVIRALYEENQLDKAFFTETRPYNQGSRLTSFELLYDKIPSTMVCDSAVSWLMKKKSVNAVVVGADRVVFNGDTANKIGTYQLAIAARAHGIPFFVAAPFSTIDRTKLSGDEIEIEERPAEEVTHIAGKAISPDGISVWNPAFDVTPASLIEGIITEKGVFTPAELSAFLKSNPSL